MENNQEQGYSPELADIINRVRAYNVTNPDAIFMFAFLGWKIDEEAEICEDCGTKCSCCPDEKKTIFSAFGDLETLRKLSEDLRSAIEDSSDKRGNVSF